MTCWDSFEVGGVVLCQEVGKLIKCLMPLDGMCSLPLDTVKNESKVCLFVNVLYNDQTFVHAETTMGRESRVIFHIATFLKDVTPELVLMLRDNDSKGLIKAQRQVQLFIKG
jgi:hypothetical protein